MLPRWLPVLLFLGWLLSSQAPAGKTSDPLPAKTITVQGDALAVQEVLQQIQQQAGVVLADRRTAGQPENIALNLKNATFWQAADTLAQKTNASLSLFQRDGVLALVDGPPAQAVSHHGIFRCTLPRLELTRDFATARHSARITLQTAWEPTFEPFYVELVSFEATYAQDAKGKRLHFTQSRSEGRTPISQPRAVDIEVRTPAPERSATHLENLHGTLAFIGPTTMQTVKFDALASILDKQKPLRQTVDGVSVTLEDLGARDSNHWVARIALQYPPGGPEFESYQSWLGNNKIYLQAKQDADQKFVPGLAQEQILQLTSRQAIIEYHFIEGKNTPKLGQPEQWQLVYRTPGRIVEVRVPFEFANVPLP
jgi:hypothetical protein